MMSYINGAYAFQERFVFTDYFLFESYAQKLQTYIFIYFYLEI